MSPYLDWDNDLDLIQAQYESAGMSGSELDLEPDYEDEVDAIEAILARPTTLPGDEFEFRVDTGMYATAGARGRASLARRRHA